VLRERPAARRRVAYPLQQAAMRVPARRGARRLGPKWR